MRSIPVPKSWRADRVAEQRYPVRLSGAQLGSPGPDQGYALSVARRFEDRLGLEGDESVEDVMVGCAMLASRRAALFGRAPCTYDLEAAFTCFGALGGAPGELVATRRRLFRSAAHHYEVQREIAEAIPEAVLRRSAAEIRELMAAEGWTSVVASQGANTH